MKESIFQEVLKTAKDRSLLLFETECGYLEEIDRLKRLEDKSRWLVSNYNSYLSLLQQKKLSFIFDEDTIREIDRLLKQGEE